MVRIVISSHDEAKFGDALLKQVLEWVTEHFTPTELYGKENLLDHIQGKYDPEDLT